MTASRQSYLNIVHTGKSRSGLTDTWAVISGDTEPIGYISWFPNWRKYVFLTAKGPQTILDEKCMREISDFIEAKTKEHKA